MRRLFPTPWLAVLVLLAIIDLATTLYWHSRGMMVELNPLMRPLLNVGPWQFSAVKIAGLLLLWIVIRAHFDKNERFCRAACATGAALYGGIWTVWAIVGNT